MKTARSIRRAFADYKKLGYELGMHDQHYGNDNILLCLNR